MYRCLKTVHFCSESDAPCSVQIKPCIKIQFKIKFVCHTVLASFLLFFICQGRPMLIKCTWRFVLMHLGLFPSVFSPHNLIQMSCRNTCMFTVQSLLQSRVVDDLCNIN